MMTRVDQPVWAIGRIVLSRAFVAARLAVLGIAALSFLRTLEDARLLHHLSAGGAFRLITIAAGVGVVFYFTERRVRPALSFTLAAAFSAIAAFLAYVTADVIAAGASFTEIFDPWEYDMAGASLIALWAAVVSWEALSRGRAQPH